MAPSIPPPLHALLVLTVGVVGQRPQLHVGGFLPATGVGFPIYPMARPAVDLAVNLINNSTDILPDYELKLEIYDTQVGLRLSTVSHAHSKPRFPAPLILQTLPSVVCTDSKPRFPAPLILQTLPSVVCTDSKPRFPAPLILQTLPSVQTPRLAFRHP